MTSHRNTAILGAGNWGTVIALLADRVAQEQGFKVYLYDVDAKKVKDIAAHRENKTNLPGINIPGSIVVTDSLETVFAQCGLIMPVIPAKFMREFASKWASYVRGDHYIVHGTKGFEPLTHKRISQVLVEETGCLRVGALSGPNLANELARGLPSASIVASPFKEVQHRCRENLTSDRFVVEGSDDLAGVELIGALKNILALASGLCAGLKLGQNATGTVLTRGLSEIRSLLTHWNASTDTVMSLAGFGDIIATSTSPESRNFRAGVLMADKLTIDEIEEKLSSTVEGFNTLMAVQSLAGGSAGDLPLIQALWTMGRGHGEPGPTLAAALHMDSR
jgi:glycerol-3-phosphate dehydrogenase (NAD(P)+)